MSEVLLGKQPCKCGSSDAKTYYMHGGSKCYSCGVGKKVDSPDGTASAPVKTAAHKDYVSLSDIKGLGHADLSARGLNAVITEMFGVRVGYDTATREPSDWYFPYRIGSEVVGCKARKVKEKDFYTVGSMTKQVEPFGWHRVSAHGKLLIITEGELDAMSATQMIKEKGKDYKVVSVPFGAQSAAEYVSKHLNLFQHFDKIILNFDADDAGIDAIGETAKVLTPGQCYIMTLPEGIKDANELLNAGQAYQYMDAINNAKEWRPDGIVAGIDTWDMYKNRPEVVSYPFPETYSALNLMTYGIRLSELDTITSGTSAGKTQWMRELVNHYVRTTDLKFGILSLEEPIEDTIESYIELGVNKRISLPDVEVSDEEELKAWEETLGSGRMVLYDAFGGEEDSVIQQIRYMAHGEKCQCIVLDHLHMLLDGKDSEKEQIERVMLKLKKLTQELGIWIGLIAHLKKSTGGGTTFEEGAIANLDDLKGSSAIKQLSNGVYVLSRDQQAEDFITRNTTQITVKKCRKTGRTGNADRLLFDDETGRMNVLKDDDVPF